MSANPALQVDNVTHRYANRLALEALSLRIAPGETFALLGPNGSGKSTLFRLISTIMPIQQGSIRVAGFDVAQQQRAVRRQLGVVFQNPAVDRQLTVAENLRCHARLYGMGGQKLKRRMALMLDRLGIADRAHHYVSTLSGGLRRRVELAKALLPEPNVLLLDEPSTGLDVSGRAELWKLLEETRAKLGLTIILTTHLMDEADRCTQIAVIDQGRLVDTGTPVTLRERVGGDVITFNGPDTQQLKSLVEQRLHVQVRTLNGALRIERPQAHLFIPQLISAVPGMIDSVAVGRPTLDDVFVHLTGRCIDAEAPGASVPDHSEG